MAGQPGEKVSGEKKKRIIAPIRQVVQLGALGLTGQWLWIGSLRCPYGIPFMSCTHCPMRVCPGRWLQPWVIGFIGLSSALAGRVFCGWACPMGAIQDLLARVPKLRALSRPRFGRWDRWLKGLKYIVLVLTVWGFYALNKRFSVPVRAHGDWSLDAIRVAWLTSDVYSHIRVIVLVSGVVLALALTRIWCRYLCPLGALLSLGNKISLWHLHRDMDKCSGCGKYPRECRTYTTPGTSDCVICGDCIEGCPRHAISFGLRWRRNKERSGGEVAISEQKT